MCVETHTHVQREQYARMLEAYEDMEEELKEHLNDNPKGSKASLTPDNVEKEKYLTFEVWWINR